MDAFFPPPMQIVILVHDPVWLKAQTNSVKTTLKRAVEAGATIVKEDLEDRSDKIAVSYVRYSQLFYVSIAGILLVH